MLIPLDAIDPPTNPVRLRVSAEADQALADSIRELGVVTPILVIRNGPRFQLVAGQRRVRAARAAGLAEIPAEVAARFDEGYVHAAASAENIVRQGMDPIDQWRSIVELQRLGYTLAGAAAALGLSERFAARLDRLGRLHPDVLALIERHGMPPMGHLRTIAMAPRERQAEAVKSRGMVSGKGDQAEVTWWKLAEALTAKAIPQARAIFDVDVAGVPFVEDLFAEPGTEAQFITHDVAGFLSAQRAALETRVDRERAAPKGGGVEIAEPAPGSAGVKLPPGWRITDGNPEKPKRHETLFYAIATEGWHLGTVLRAVAVNAAEEKRREREAAAKAKAKAKDAPPAEPADAAPTEATEPDDDDTADTPPPPPPEPKLPVTKHGQAIVGRAKTEALRARLRDATRPLSLEQAVVHLVLALHAANVRIEGYAPMTTTWDCQTGRDLVARLVGPDGLLLYDAAELPTLAAEALARTLSVSHPESTSYNPGSGPTAEWIGHALGADSYLPRLDTAEFLATASADLLREACAFNPIGTEPIKPGTAGAMRKALEGQRAGWLPPFAQFGAPGPKPAPERAGATESDEDGA